MAEIGSDEWIAALDRVARADDALRAASRGRTVEIGQEVVDGPRRARWSIVLDDGEVSVRRGWSERPDVTLRQNLDLARRISRGEASAAASFLMGDLRLGGDGSLLVELAPALAGLGDVFEAVRRDAASTDPVGDGPDA